MAEGSAGEAQVAEVGGGEAAGDDGQHVVRQTGQEPRLPVFFSTLGRLRHRRPTSFLFFFIVVVGKPSGSSIFYYYFI